MEGTRQAGEQHGLAGLPFVSDERISVSILFFPDGDMEVDIDNIVKPILDARCKHIYRDDRQVERLVVQKFEPGYAFGFADSTAILASALTEDGPLLYVRVSNDPFEDLR